MRQSGAEPGRAQGQRGGSRTLHRRGRKAATGTGGKPAAGTGIEGHRASETIESAETESNLARLTRHELHGGHIGLKSKIGLDFKVHLRRSRGQVILVTVVYSFDLVRSVGQRSVEVIGRRLDSNKVAILSDIATAVGSHGDVAHRVAIDVEGDRSVRRASAAVRIDQRAKACALCVSCGRNDNGGRRLRNCNADWRRSTC